MPNDFYIRFNHDVMECTQSFIYRRESRQPITHIPTHYKDNTRRNLRHKFDRIYDKHVIRQQEAVCLQSKKPIPYQCVE